VGGACVGIAVFCFALFLNLFFKRNRDLRILYCSIAQLAITSIHYYLWARHRWMNSQHVALNPTGG
jgi:hypothetical protein